MKKTLCVIGISLVSLVLMIFAASFVSTGLLFNTDFTLLSDNSRFVAMIGWFSATALTISHAYYEGF